MKRTRRTGFTLVEILTVIALIAILAAIVLGLAGSAQKMAARRKAAAEISQLENALTDYQRKYGAVPIDLATFSNELVASHHALTNLLDPWGMPYRYQASSPATFYLWSLGGDAAGVPAHMIGNHP